MEIEFDSEKEYNEFIKWANDKTPNKKIQEKLKRYRELKGRYLTNDQQLELARTTLNMRKK